VSSLRSFLERSSPPYKSTPHSSIVVASYTTYFRATNPLPNQLNDNIFNSKDDLGVNITTRPVSSRPHRMHAFSHSHDSSFIKEGNWTLDKMVEKPAFITNFVWNTTQASHSVLYSAVLPTDILVSALQKSTVNNFLYWRGEIELHFQVLGTPFHTGCLMASFVPLSRRATGATFPIVNNFAALSVNPTAYLQPNSSTSAVMTIPFVTPYEYLDVLNNNDINNQQLGTISVVVLNQLAAATGSSTAVEVSVFAKFVGNQFKVPRFTPEGMFSSAAQSLFGRSLGNIIQSMLPENIIADSVDTLMDVVGLDKPSTVLLQEPMRPLSTQYLNSNRGIDFIDKFELNPSNMQPVDPETFGSTADDMLMQDLFSRYSYLGTFNLTTADAGGKIIGAIPLSPCPAPISTSNLGSASQVPLLQYLSYPFKFWRGGLKYKIQVVSTSMVTAKIYASVNYGVYANFLPTVSRQALTAQYGFAFEINQGSNTFEFDVPYVSSFPQLIMPNSNAINSECALGLLSFVVVNPLTISNNSPDLVRFNVFLAGAEDFELSTLSGTFMYPLIGNPYPAPALSSIEEDELMNFEPESLQPMETVLDQVDQTHSAPILAPQQNEKSKIPSKAERPVDNVYDLLRKYQMTATLFSRIPSNTEATNASIGFNVVNIYDMISTNTGLYSAPNLSYRASLINYFSPIFRLFKGPLRFKIVSLKPFNGCFQAYYVPYIDRTQIWTDAEIRQYFIEALSFTSTTTTALFKNTQPQLMSQTANGFQNTLEFEIPFATPLKSIILDSVSQPPSLMDSPLGKLVIVAIPNFPQTEAVNIPFQIYIAFGDETRFGLPIAVPRIGPNVIIPSANNASIGPVDFSNTVNSEFTLTIL
jgi:hypothetical protein